MREPPLRWKRRRERAKTSRAQLSLRTCSRGDGQSSSQDQDPQPRLAEAPHILGRAPFESLRRRHRNFHLLPCQRQGVSPEFHCSLKKRKGGGGGAPPLHAGQVPFEPAKGGEGRSFARRWAGNRLLLEGPRAPHWSAQGEPRAPRVAGASWRLRPVSLPAWNLFVFNRN